MTTSTAPPGKCPPIRRPEADILMSIENSPIHKLQLEMWQVDSKAFEAERSDSQEELRRLKSESYHVASMSLIFQGVIFTAVAQTNLLTCSLAWSPIALSIIVALASILAIADKLHEFGEIKHELAGTDENIHALVKARNDLDRDGADLNLDTYTPRAKPPIDNMPGLRQLASIYGLSSLIFLLSFSIVISCFSYQILCNNCKSCPQTK